MEQKLKKLIENLRPGQDSLAKWVGGKMAVSAVPGSGKSHSLAVAGAITIARQKLNLQRQLIIVTYTRSAAASIKQKIESNLEYLGLPPIGFSVQTIHGLALHIATQHPELSQLNLNTNTLISPKSNHRIVRQTVDKWIKENPFIYQGLVEGIQGFDSEESEQMRRQDIIRTNVLPEFACTIISQAKSYGLTPEELNNYGNYIRDQYQSGYIASGLYQNYQTLMSESNFIDYDDMILGALKVLENQEARQMWQQKTFAVFEDEAQDSSPLQVELLEILATDHQNTTLEPNLVRVGDPNQAINSTFTTADPIYFDWFCDQCMNNNSLFTIAQAGRSSQVIMNAANKMLTLVNQKNLETISEKINLPFRHQYIEAVDKNDPQQNANPAPRGKGVEILQPANIYETVRLMGKKIEQLFATKKDQNNHNLAILIKDKNQAIFIFNHLQYLKEEYNLEVKIINDKTNLSYIPLEILQVLQFIDRPHSPEYFKNVLEILQQRELINLPNLGSIKPFPEKFLYPTEIDKKQNVEEKKARYILSTFLKAKLELVHYQIIPYVAMALGYNKTELATTHKLSERIEKEIVGRNSLKMKIYTLKSLINTESFENIDAMEDGQNNSDNIYTRCGQVTIMTMHKSKGLDWDYVFIPFLQEDNFPGVSFVSNNTKFLGDFNLTEVVKTQLRFLVHQDKFNSQINKYLSTTEAWKESEMLRKNESYRLLYVAMTRAKKLLWMSSAQKAPFNWAFFTDNNDISSLDKKNKNPCFLIEQL